MDSSNDFLRNWWPVLLVGIVLVGIVLYASSMTSDLRTWAEFEAQLQVGRPVVVEVFSPT